MAYSTVASVKLILQIDSEDVSYDTEITSCISSADALVDGLLKRAGLTVPDSVPQTLADCSSYFAAWLFKDRRGPNTENVEDLWVKAHKFLDTYIESEEEIAFLVGSSYD